jgi:hypothetical protein
VIVNPGFLKNWAWAICGLPLIASASAIFYILLTAPESSALILFVILSVVAGTLAGVITLYCLLTGWHRGLVEMWDLRVIAAIIFACLDIAMPFGVALLVWLIVKALSGGLIF